jgi:hypothetical protein
MVYKLNPLILTLLKWKLLLYRKEFIYGFHHQRIPPAISIHKRYTTCPHKSSSATVGENQLKIIFIIRYLFNNNICLIAKGKTNGVFIRHTYLPTKCMLINFTEKIILKNFAVKKPQFIIFVTRAETFSHTASEIH